MKSLLFLTVLVLLISLSSCKNILFISTLPSPSHHIYNRVLAVGLAEKGHNVTFLSADKLDKVVRNLHYIHVEKVYEAMAEDFGGNDFLAFAKVPTVVSMITMASMCTIMSKGSFISNGLEFLLSYPKDFEFDLIIYDFTGGPFLLPLVTRFNNPILIALTAFVNPPYTTEYVGGHKYPAYIPHLNVNFGTKMNFFQRFYNTFLYILDWG
jgi:glucuronosyltransferase